MIFTTGFLVLAIGTLCGATLRDISTEDWVYAGLRRISTVCVATGCVLMIASCAVLIFRSVP